MNAAQRSKRRSRSFHRPAVAAFPQLQLERFELYDVNAALHLNYWTTATTQTVTTEMRSTISITTSATHYPSHHSERERWSHHNSMAIILHVWKIALKCKFSIQLMGFAGILALCIICTVVHQPRIVSSHVIRRR